ncbi:MAG TPA: M3 family metallopeptidase [Patescibacteria group bacterium]|nr:M3 family metallopeptidase [Patescibacteria group bacterium]
MTFPSELSSNPLVNPPNLPDGALPFGLVKEADYRPAFDWALAQVKAEVEAIKQKPASFENTIEGLEFSGQDLGRVRAVLSSMAQSNTTEALDKLEAQIGGEISEYYAQQAQDDELFAKVEAVYNARHSLNLDSQQKRVLEKVYDGFVRSGALLPPEKKERLQAIEKELTELGSKFKSNANKSRAQFGREIYDESELAGIPDDEKAVFREAFTERADAAKKIIDEGKLNDVPAETRNAVVRQAAQAGQPGWLVKLVPDPLIILTHADNRALREEVVKARMNIACTDGPFDNRPVIRKILELRYEKAQLLGKDSHADFVLEDRMAHNKQTVNALLEKNLKAYQPAAAEHLEKVKELAATEGVSDLRQWDYLYYERKLAEKEFNVDEQKLKRYFEIENVTKGLHQFAEEFFGITLTEMTDRSQYPVYADDMKVYEVREKSDGSLIGLFYEDYYTRGDAKRAGAWMEQLNSRIEKDGKVVTPVVINNCNFKKGADGQPTLLTHRDVETMFHEFGHGLHGLLTKSRYPSIGGTNVKYDFVELPSQLLENWTLEPEVLNKFAHHAETGQPIPAEEVQKIVDAKNFNAGYVGLRQTFFGLLDMAYHTVDPKTIPDIEALEDGVWSKCMLLPRDGQFQSTGFGHLFADPVGYSSGYYCYKWAEVLDADAFTRFKGNLYDPAARKQLRDVIYAGGDTEDPAELFRRFMGRDKDPDALYRREGIIKVPPAVNQNQPEAGAQGPKLQAG